jgi:phospholipid-transporting ATPase
MKGWKNIQMAKSEIKDELLDRHADVLEQGLKLAGITAIEDKLQDGVPDTIKVLMEADIRVWVLTGDKEETAIEIAKSCNLIQPHMEVVKIFTHDQKETVDTINNLFSQFSLEKYPDYISLEKYKTALQTQLAIVINGIALSYVLENNEIKEKFFKLGFISNSCVCCRVSPSQKMFVVRLSSTFGKWISLAIGDGANDVSMIQEAHIGVGIAGKEGTQAVQAAEFTFCQFKSLKPLLLVHGRSAYFRISIFIMYYFYKNFLSVFTELWFAIFSGFSGQIYFLDWLPSMYNTFWTSWPCLTFFTLERDLTPKDSLVYSNLYSAGQKSFYFNVGSFWRWIGFAFLSACWIYWLPVVSVEGGVSSNGRGTSLFWMSTVSFIMLIHTVNLKLLITAQFWPRGSL